MATPADPAARRVTFATREVLKKHYEAHLAHHGLVIPSSEPLPEGTELDVQLVLPEQAGTLTVLARVVATQEAAAGGAYELQLQLLDFDEEKHATVRAVLSGAPPASAAASPPRPAPASASPPRPTAAEASRADAADEGFVELEPAESGRGNGCCFGHKELVLRLNRTGLRSCGRAVSFRPKQQRRARGGW